MQASKLERPALAIAAWGFLGIHVAQVYSRESDILDAAGGGCLRIFAPGVHAVYLQTLKTRNTRAVFMPYEPIHLNKFQQLVERQGYRFVHIRIAPTATHQASRDGQSCLHHLRPSAQSGESGKKIVCSVQQLQRTHDEKMKSTSQYRTTAGRAVDSLQTGLDSTIPHSYEAGQR